MSQEFSKAKIYKITNDYNDDIYVGSTCDELTKRFSKHKADSRNPNKNNRPLYRLVNEIGFERFRIELIEDYPCQDKYQLRQREGHFIRLLGTLNVCIAGRTVNEWYIDFYAQNKEKLIEQQKEYRKNNNSKISEKIECSCGCRVRRDNISNHKKTKKHIELMKEKEEN